MASSSFGTLFRHKASGKQIVCKPISIEVKSNWTFQNAAFGWTTESICSATVLSRTTCGHRLLLVGVDLKGPWHWYVLLLSPSSLITSLWTCKLPVSPRPQSRVCVCFLRYVEPGGTCNIQVQVKPSRLEIPLEPLCHWKRAQFWQIGQVEWVSQPCINRVFMEDMPTDRKLLQFVIFFLVVTEAHDTPVDRKQTTH